MKTSILSKDIETLFEEGETIYDWQEDRPWYIGPKPSNILKHRFNEKQRNSLRDTWNKFLKRIFDMSKNNPDAPDANIRSLIKKLCFVLKKKHSINRIGSFLLYLPDKFPFQPEDHQFPERVHAHLIKVYFALRAYRKYYYLEYLIPDDDWKHDTFKPRNLIEYKNDITNYQQKLEWAKKQMQLYSIMWNEDY